MKKIVLIIVVIAVALGIIIGINSSKKPAEAGNSYKTMSEVGKYVNTAMEKAKAKDFNGAISDINEAIAINPHNASLYMKRGLFKEYQRDIDGAMKDYEKAAELQPEDPTIPKRIEFLQKRIDMQSQHQ